MPSEPNSSYVYIKQIVDQWSQDISYYFNESITLGSFPDVSKITRVIPLFKNGDNSSVTNYRPISILPIIFTIFEKLMFKRLNNTKTFNNGRIKLRNKNQ